jgi:hypothetical protein
MMDALNEKAAITIYEKAAQGTQTLQRMPQR